MSQDHRYMRQMFLPQWGKTGQETLERSRVLCVGVGGLGSSILQYLAGAGVGTLGLVDFDVVDITNLHRQVLFRDFQKGVKKVLAARSNLLELNPNIDFKVYDMELKESSLLQIRDLFQLYDLIIDGTDNFQSKYLINDICTELHKPWVYGAISQWQGQVSVFWAPNRSLIHPNRSLVKDYCYRCAFPQPPISSVASCAQSGVMGALPGVVGSYQAIEAIKMLFYMKHVSDFPDDEGSERAENRLIPLLGQILILSLDRNEFFKIPLSSSKSCQHRTG